MEHHCRLCCLPTSLSYTPHLLCEPENFACPPNSEENGVFFIFIINAIPIIKGYQESVLKEMMAKYVGLGRPYPAGLIARGVHLPWLGDVPAVLIDCRCPFCYNC